MAVGKGRHKIAISGALPLEIIKEGDLFVAYTPALDLSTYGETYKEAVDNFNEALFLFIDELVEKGTLEQIFEECGWEKVKTPKPHWVPPSVVGREELQLQSLQ